MIVNVTSCEIDVRKLESQHDCNLAYLEGQTVIMQKL